MKKEKEQNKKRREHNKGEIFTKIMAGMLAVLMIGGTCATLIFALM